MNIPFKVDLTDKVAIVTGGSGTLCSAMAEALATCNAKVAILGRDKAKLDEVVGGMRAKGLTVNGYSCDVCDKRALIETYELIKNDFGTCDILINGAGGNKPDAITVDEWLKAEEADTDTSFWKLNEMAIRDVMDLNYMGTMLPIQVFTEDMRIKRSGSIINIASVAGMLPLTKVVTYGNAKSAIVNLTQWIAVHMGESGVRCNAISPGFYAAKQNYDLLFNPDGSKKPRAEKIIAHTPMGRFGKPEDLVGTVLFLASNEASGFINGAVIPVDGGFMAYSGV